MNKYDYSSGDIIRFYCIGIVLGCALGMAIMSGLVKGNEITELGNAICDQEYNMTFVSYVEGELSCKQGIVKQEYDGLNVQLISSTT